MTIDAGRGDRTVSLRMWIDANHPAVHLEIDSRSPVQVETHLEIWRTERRKLTEEELFSAYGLHGENPDPVYVASDTVLPGTANRITWYHRNERSIWAENLRLQSLGPLTDRMEDPLLKRTFGGMITGSGTDDAPMERTGRQTLATTSPTEKATVSIYPLTARTETPGTWRDRLKRRLERLEEMPLDQARARHREWWQAFWDRSGIYVTGSGSAEAVGRGYALQRFIHAAAGRGEQPIKFNGSIFTVNLEDSIKNVPPGLNADYRDWGGAYWWQNTRLPYWSMLMNGDFDLMRPLFEMYVETLPLARYRTARYFEHEGAFFPETMYFWGTWVNENYGWDRDTLAAGVAQNRYTRYEWQSGLELTVLMLDYFRYTDRTDFLRERLLPFADAILTFYDQHYGRDANGELRIEPAQALETYWDSVNPMPVVAGLHHVLDRLLALPAPLVDAEMRARWQRLRNDLPPLPRRQAGGTEVLGFAEEVGPKRNVENPELYAVFPYRLFGTGKENLELARATFTHRIHKGTGGWSQDPIQAALLGLTDTASQMVTSNFSTSHPGFRFPAFWGPNYDWVPDQDHGSVAMIALQRMLLQTEGDTVRLFPAWPETWDVRFTLRAPRETTIEGTYVNGELTDLEVTPERRRADVIDVSDDAETSE